VGGGEGIAPRRAKTPNVFMKGGARRKKDRNVRLRSNGKHTGVVAEKMPKDARAAGKKEEKGARKY